MKKAVEDELEEAYQFVERIVDQRDGWKDGSPWWYAPALRKAFMAGVEWQKARKEQNDG